MAENERKLIECLNILNGENFIIDGKLIPVKPGIDPIDIIKYNKEIKKGNGLHFGLDAKLCMRNGREMLLTKDELKNMQDDANAVKKEITRLLPLVEREIYGEQGAANVTAYEKMLVTFFKYNGLDVSRVDAGNPETYKKLNKLIHEKLEFIYSDSAPDSVKAKVDGSCSDLLGANVRGCNTKRAIGEESKALRDEVQRNNLALPEEDLDEFERLAKSYAMSCVSPMIAVCIDCPDFHAETGDMLNEYGQKETDENKGYDSRNKMLREHLTHSIDGLHDVRDTAGVKKEHDAWQELQDFIVNKKINTENLKPKRGGEKVSFEGMLNIMTRGYCIGYLQVHPQLLNYLDPKKLNHFMPTRINLKNAEGKIERTTYWEHKKKEVEITHSDPDANKCKRTLTDHKKLQKATEIKDKGYKNTRTPYRGLFKIFARYQKLIAMMTASIQQTGYLLKFMKTLGYNLLDENQQQTVSTKYDQAMRNDLKTRSNIAFLHAEQVTCEGEPKSNPKVNEYMDLLLKMDSEINDENNKMEALDTKFNNIKVNSQDNGIIQYSDEQKFDYLISRYSERIKLGQKNAIINEFYNGGKGLNGNEAQDLISLIERYSKEDIAQCDRESIKEEQGLLKLLSKHGERCKKQFHKSTEIWDTQKIKDAMEAYKASGKDAKAMLPKFFPADQRGELHFFDWKEIDQAYKGQPLMPDVLRQAGWSRFMDEMLQQYEDAGIAFNDAKNYERHGSGPRGNAEAMNAFYEAFERGLKVIAGNYIAALNAGQQATVYQPRGQSRNERLMGDD